MIYLLAWACGFLFAAIAELRENYLEEGEYFALEISPLVFLLTLIAWPLFVPKAIVTYYKWAKKTGNQ